MKFSILASAHHELNGSLEQITHEARLDIFRSMPIVEIEAPTWNEAIDRLAETAMYHDFSECERLHWFHWFDGGVIRSPAEVPELLRGTLE